MYLAKSDANNSFSLVAQETAIVTPFSLAPLSAPHVLIVLFRMTAKEGAESTSSWEHWNRKGLVIKHNNSNKNSNQHRLAIITYLSINIPWQNIFSSINMATLP